MLRRCAALRLFAARRLLAAKRRPEPAAVTDDDACEKLRITQPRAGLLPHAAREARRVDYSTLVQTASDEFMFVVRFNLKHYKRSIDVDDFSNTNDLLAEGSWCQMLDVNGRSDAPLVRFEQRSERIDGGVFELPDQCGRTQDGRHGLVREINRVLGRSNKAQLTAITNFGRTFHA